MRPDGNSSPFAYDGVTPTAQASDSQFTGMVQDLSRSQLPAGFRGRSAIVVQLWWIVQATLFGLSPQFMYGWRRFLLRLFGCRVGDHVLVRPTARIQFPWKVTLGDWCQIGDNAELYSLGPIHIGANAVVSQQAYLCAGSHDIYSPTFDIYAAPIVVEPEAWVCARAWVYPGVTVGHGAVIGACSVLRRDAQPYGIHVGPSATMVGDRRVRPS